MGQGDDAAEALVGKTVEHIAEAEADIIVVGLRLKYKGVVKVCHVDEGMVKLP